MILPPERVQAICSELTAAGDGWIPVARRLPEYVKHSKGRPSGRGLHRPWVLLDGSLDEGVPARLLRYETGVWFAKGEYLTDVERKS